MRAVFVLIPLLLFSPIVAHAESPAKVGDRVELKATHHLGVPFHKEPRGTPDFQRVPDGTTATVTELAQEGRWLKLQLAGGNTGWILAKYVGRVIAGDQPPPPPESDAERQVWESPEECQRVVAGGGKLPKNTPDALRLGTWNLRWFPKGCSPGEQCPENATDIPWLACTIVWMDINLLAVQEIGHTQQAESGLQALRTALDQQTGGAWQVDLQQCGPESSQHVGFLWNSQRLTLENQVDVAALNGAANGTPASACAGNLRPGRYAHVKTQGGVDFHLLSVHLDSGTTDRDYQHRRIAVERISSLAVDGTPLLTTDPDVIVVGDYNTMGRKEAPPISAQEEITTLQDELAPSFSRRPPTPACSEYFDGKAGLLDHVVASTGMQEAAATARVTGYCAVAQCKDDVNPMPAAYEKLSDHCPTVFEVQNTDVD